MMNFKLNETVAIGLGCFFLSLLSGCNPSTPSTQMDSVVLKPYELWEPAPAPNRGHEFGVDKLGRGYPYDKDWERWSYPLGNGTLGANVFGRTDVERIQISEKTFANGSAYGRGSVTNAAELYLEFGHDDVTDYRRALNLNDAINTVSYQSGGVKYQREYFTSYPDDVMVIRLTADQPGALSFTVRPEIPYLQSKDELDTKSGMVTAAENTITLAGTIDYYQINYEIQVKVLAEGGKTYTGESTIEIQNADAVTLIVAADTNYELRPELFLNEPKQKLDPTVNPHPLVVAKINQATKLGFEALKVRHLDDYQELFSRVDVDLNSTVSELPTHQLLAAYREGEHDPYLEELVFQYGRYLLIASSRETSLPAHLQGAWSQYEVSPWCAGYWHNINVQMNYWGAMSTDLSETFEGYLNYFEAYMPKAQQFAHDYIQETRPEALSDDPVENGWILGTGANAYQISGRSSHSGPGTGGFTTQLLMEYYLFTQDEEFLRETGYPAMLGMSKFFNKTLYETEDGLLLIRPSASPEIKHNGSYYNTEGCTYDQGFVWENHTNVLRAAAVLGKSDPFLEVIKAQIPRLDPILIGSSGQIKEFREEDAYGEIGDPHHRHISHLCPLYPGTLINDSHPDWMEAASVTLDLRGEPGNGWATAHRMNARARLQEGEKALDLYRLFITDRAAENLWSMHPPFQIDGNLGVMAGVAEMLLQSHEGFIKPIPALPKAWSTGSFHGLVARGNFKVSAEWKAGDLSSLSILSRSGGVCRINYPGIASAEVTGARGQKIVVEAEGSDIISFPTVTGSSYSFQFPAVKKTLFAPEELITVGAFYYPEHWDESQWERDIKRMADLGLEFVHMGEFSWASLEPEEGKYDFEWLDTAVDLSEKYGLKVILCSTSATPPAWLSTKHPEILRVDENGNRLAHGRRQQASFSSDFYRQYSLKLIEKLAKRYGNNPTVMGWQLDNEPKGTVDYSENATRRFRIWLKKKYGNIDNLNRAWGAAFWSMTYNNFDQITLPRLTLGMNNPHQHLDHDRFMAYETASHLSLQAETIRKHAAPDQWITTNFENDRDNADPWLNKDLDFVSYTTYMAHAYNMGIGDEGYRRGLPHHIVRGADYYRPIGGVTGIMELQPGQINWSRVANPLLEPGSVRMWLWHAYAAGNDFASTYRFRQPTYGSEMYHYGIMDPDGVTPSYSGIDFSTFAGEIRKLRKEYDPNHQPNQAYQSRKTGIMFARDNRWRQERRPLTKEWDHFAFVVNHYYPVVKSFAAPVDFIDEEKDFSDYPVIVAPAYQLLDQGLVDKWEAYVKQGGHLVLGARTGQMTRDGQLWQARRAEPILELIGAEVFGFDIIPSPNKGSVDYQGQSYAWNIWGDILEPMEGTEVWATYGNSFYQGKAAVTHRKLGEGTVTYIGPYSHDAALERAVLRRVYDQAGIKIEDLPEGMMMEYRDGFGIAVNYSDQDYEVPAPADAEFIFGQRQIGRNGVAVWK